MTKTIDQLSEITSVANDDEVLVRDTSTGNDVRISTTNFFQGNSFSEMGQGAIIETGSNADGDFVRWENGFQVCFKNDATFSAQSVDYQFSWTFPNAFNATPHIGAPVLPSDGSEWDTNSERSNVSVQGYSFGNSTASIGAMRIYPIDTGTISGDIREVALLAVGFWT